ncbi:BFH_collapsed_G0027580.mRNA.1.CDS.1 [Saccharomyces cerevisiae]|nr:BFH_collapsed_G0027580.mRNA.1.CDS.1 [Saccharomyces cerevisiae]
MSLEPTQTVSGTPPMLHQRTHKQVYPLRMETIPILESDSKATLQSNEPTQKDEEETEYFENKQSVSNLSPDLKFKRHKNKHIQGFPTLGERLDNLQDIKKAKRPFYSQPTAAGGPDMTTPQNISSSQQLLPAPQLFPYGSFHQQQLQQPHYIQRTRERKKSIGSQRGRRLSMLASQANGGSTIISPHKDIPEEDFYTVVGNASFGKNLQIRQLFNWCLMRSLHKLELKAKNQEEEGELEHLAKKSKLESTKAETDYVDPKRLAMVIIKEFVDDLKKDHIAIDWEDEEKYEDEDEEKILDNTENYDDTELRQLFQENDDDDDDDDEVDYSEIQRSRRKFSERRKALPKEPKKLLPNSKNVENTKNLSILTSKVNAIKNEVKEWAVTLDTSRPDLEWQELTSFSSQPLEPLSDTEEPDLAIADVETKLETKVDELRYQSHILNSHSLALNEITNSKVNKLNIETMRKISSETDDDHSQVINPQQLLKGLSLSFSKKLDL